ncbi:MAG: polysaccharide deacetylase family protein, partial [Bacteroidetes bacterium]|nr:polysaccharide deacetylase family protein [Bacteroidota bacterium]
MSIYFKIKRAIACLLIQQKNKLDLSEPIVSFTFDDVENSAFTNGASILKKYGYHGTYYISLGLSYKNESRNGIFDSDLLEGIVNDGGELACHTYS